MYDKKVQALTLTAPRELALRDYPYPKVETGATLIRVECVGICGTDKHSFQGNIVQYGGRILPLPVIPGHEVVGIIEEIGGEVLDHDGNPLKRGDRVVVGANVPCKRCYYCRNGFPYYYCSAKLDYGNNLSASQPPHLFGGWSEYLYALPNSPLFRFPDTLPPELGVFIEPMAVTASLDKAREWSSTWEPFRVADTVVVLGVGPIGLCHVIKANLLGAGNIIAVELASFRLALAKQFGANQIMKGDNPEVVQAQVLEATDGRGAEVVVDCTGVPQGFGTALNLLREGGRVREVGSFTDAGDIPVNPHRHICAKSARVMGVGGDKRSAYVPSIRLLEKTQGVFPWLDLITHRFALPEWEQAFAAALSLESMKVVFVPHHDETTIAYERR
jgi:L-iditol 2-dehydrogenase